MELASSSTNEREYGSIQPGSVLANLESLNIDKLAPPDQSYFRGLISTNSLSALGEFNNAINQDPYHYSAQKLACVTGLSLADFENVIELARVPATLSGRQEPSKYQLVWLSNVAEAIARR